MIWLSISWKKCDNILLKISENIVSLGGNKKINIKFSYTIQNRFRVCLISSGNISVPAPKITDFSETAVFFQSVREVTDKQFHKF